ncbi:hypothetical protein I3843_03G081600 [Carya illinoinensis]|uniref:Protein kinase domain-containing protein n=1 Tax=Carya illinoinensis TaxID=32201 RepID=A0A922FJJ1_CARIL|nr:hypothetical protein I3760_03G078800 [Carya illinoinensis]KAG6720825.1 hypothetical protein I3842_03G081600 [Carya illinoinensis]KAG7986462.1 hypothetical protein I3843_03G081600 [Carya illinoinensis]
MSTPLLPLFTPLCLVFLPHFLAITVAGDLPSPYTPVDNILLNCGSSGNSTTADGRIWIGEASSKFLPLEVSKNQPSLSASAAEQSSTAAKVPFETARLSLSPFTYTFKVTPGQKFLRLHFYPSFYSTFNRSNSLFTVKAGRFTLLRNFNASLTADADGDSGDTLYKEYCVNIDEDQKLDITFIPSSSVSNSYAFINGIEILSMPPNLYYTPAEKDLTFIGQQNRYRINYSTSLEMIYRLNVGGPHISPANDTGMFREWRKDYEYLKEHKVLFQPCNETIKLRFTKSVPAYTAPEDVYRTARILGNDSMINLSYNLTWEFPVDSGFYYFIRLHFCEFQPDIIKVNDRKFRIFIADQIAEEKADVIFWSGRNGVPTYRDYAVSMIGKGSDKRGSLHIAIGAEPQKWETSLQDAILNGVEIFKVSVNDNLAGPNPDPLPPISPRASPPRQSTTNSKKNRTTIIAVTAIGASGFIVLSILVFLIFQRRKGDVESGSTNRTTWWGLLLFTTTESTNTRRSYLPSALSRYFSLAEIRAATNDFDDLLIIGVGGFGNVYKGYIDGGVNSVAIKRLVPGSEQGALEFETEIEMLSQLRHQHLVSLIGYCNDRKEMILVYDYMSRGTLRDHLYNSNNPPLSWKQRLQICIGAAQGLNYLHTGANQMIIHRDVKTTNILLDEEWVAKVSDFGLSKMGPTSVSKTHVSTVVKGSFGYLDPEYYRRQQLTEKSDVYSFGVVLCEVLCARPPIFRTAEKNQVSLAEWVRQSSRNGEFHQIIDQTLKGQVAPECLKKFGEVALSCLLDNGVERPSMNDVVWSLEFAFQLQESIDKAGRLDVVNALLPPSKSNDSENLFSGSSWKMSSTTSNGEMSTTSTGEQSFRGISND